MNFILLIFLYFSPIIAEHCCPPTDVISTTPGDTVLRQRLDRTSSEPIDCVSDDQVCVGTNFGRTILLPRPSGNRLDIEMVGSEENKHTCRYPGYYTTVTTALGYQRTYRPERIAQQLFGRTIINFVGSQVGDRTEFDWIADYFGLPTDFRGKLKLDPVIQNIFLTTDIFFGLDTISCGLFSRIQLPIVYSKWDLNACEYCPTSTNTTGNFPTCYMSDTPAHTAKSIKEAFDKNFTFGDAHDNFNYGSISFKALKAVKFADFNMLIGWDLFKYDQYTFGIYTKFVAPTSGKPKINYIFSPINGNGGYFEWGMGICGNSLLWERGPDTTLRIFYDAYVDHCFQNSQIRSFDLCHKDQNISNRFSRFMLLKEFASDGVTYSGNLLRTINLTTLPVKVSIPVKGEAVVALSYRNYSVDFDFGYNFFGRTHENVKICQKSLSKNVGIKGTEGVCYQIYSTSGTPAQFGSLVGESSLNSTQSNATIRTSANTDNGQNVVTAPGTIAVSWNNSRVTGPASGTGVVLAQQSNNPVLLSICDINKCSGAAAPYATHTFFLYLGYSPRPECSNIDGFIGIGGSIEFEGLARNDRSSLNQWIFFTKCGLTF